MAPQRHTAAQRQWTIVIVAAAGLASAVVASFTRPFTAGADVVTALALVVAAVTVAVRLCTSRRSDVPLPPNSQHQDVTTMSRWSFVWVGMAVVIACWELYCYTSTPRPSHPTLSTLINLLDSTRVGKSVAFALWLALGCYLVLQ
jgi:hypothetical protein